MLISHILFACFRIVKGICTVGLVYVMGLYGFSTLGMDGKRLVLFLYGVPSYSVLIGRYVGVDDHDSAEEVGDSR